MISRRIAIGRNNQKTPPGRNKLVTFYWSFYRYIKYIGEHFNAINLFFFFPHKKKKQKPQNDWIGPRMETCRVAGGLFDLTERKRRAERTTCITIASYRWRLVTDTPPVLIEKSELLSGNYDAVPAFPDAASASSLRGFRQDFKAVLDLELLRVSSATKWRKNIDASRIASELAS